MLKAEIAIRLVISTEAALISLLLIRAGQSNRVYLASASLFLCILGYMTAPVLLQNGGFAPLAYTAVLLANLAPVSFWYLACAIFRDSFSPTFHPLLPIAVTGALGMAGFLTGPRLSMDWLDWTSQAVKLAWVAAAVVVATRDWRADLVEPRRKVRRLLVLLIGAYMVTIMMVELLVPGQVPVGMELLNVLAIFVLVTAAALHLLAIDRDNIFARIVDPGLARSDTKDVSPLAREVLELMANERVYATEGLTLDKLAAQLRTQPHVLRKVINGELGHRNFNSFVNLYRVNEVAQRLELPEHADTPLLTLALDAGFRSLAPFNRSFRERFGVTPSAYRSSLSESK